MITHYFTKLAFFWRSLRIKFLPKLLESLESCFLLLSVASVNLLKLMYHTFRDDRTEQYTMNLFILYNSFKMHILKYAKSRKVSTTFILIKCSQHARSLSTCRFQLILNQKQSQYKIQPYPTQKNKQAVEKNDEQRRSHCTTTWLFCCKSCYKKKKKIPLKTQLNNGYPFFQATILLFNLLRTTKASEKVKWPDEAKIEHVIAFMSACTFS